MITVAIVGILAGIAYASYDFAVTKTRRGAAQSCLLQHAQMMERFYTVNMSYKETTAGAAVPNPSCESDVTAHYTVTYDGTPTASAYRLKAEPKGKQATSDTKCGTLGIDQTGAKSPSTAGCW